MCVLYVHELVADVIGRLDQIDQRVAGKSQWLSFPAQAAYAQFVGYAQVVLLLAVKESELGFPSGQCGGEGILDDAGQCGVCHDESSRPASAELVGQQAEGIGVALEVCQVCPFLVRKPLFEGFSGPFGEVRPDGLLARVSEGWVAKVVGQAGSRDDGAYLLHVGALQFGVEGGQCLGYVFAQ